MSGSGSDVLHPIRVVARRTGLSPDLIRAWERRYGAVTPVRDESNSRLYTDADVERLALLRRAVEGGRAIRQVATLDDAALAEMTAADDRTAPEPSAVHAGRDDEPDLDRIVAALASYDGEQLGRTLRAIGDRLDPVELARRVVSPLLARFGDERRDGRLGAAHEALLRPLLRMQLAAGIRSSLGGDAPGPLAVVTSGSGSRDDLPGLASAAVASGCGFRVVTLSQGLTPEELSVAVRATGGAVLLIGLEPPAPGRNDEAEVLRLRRLLGSGTALAAVALDGPSPAGGHRLDLLPFAELKPALARIAASPAAIEPPRLFVPISVELRRRLALGLPEQGPVVLDEIATLRRLAHRLAVAGPQPPFADRGAATAGELAAASVLHAFWHCLACGRPPTQLSDPRLDALEWLDARLGRDLVDRALAAVRTSGLAAPRPSIEAGGATTSVESEVAGLLLRGLAARNPALATIRGLAFEPSLDSTVEPLRLAAELERFLSDRADRGRDLLELALAPERAAPDSLAGQLEAVLEIDERIGSGLGREARTALDLLREERRPGFVAGAPPPEPELPGLASLRDGEARYLPDREWMAGLVLQAKHTLVWMEQLERGYGRPVRRLDAIPDAELARLARLGVTGLWLVGIWRRSRASGRLKLEAGNAAAGPSAYALDDYVVAEELGGEPALAELRRRALAHGIRLGADVVANHMGIDSRWVLEHPERFLSVARSPFPSYTFDGPDLSPDPSVGLYVADQYRDGSDAPVVFRRIDRRTGEERFVYHGNDGTGLPWNDTAQLDYLRPDTREAMIRTIVDVARRVPILRLDAAMTLVREHFHRLWYPAPGSGGAIPSRAGHGLECHELERRMPRELWAEVVERVSEEAPDTLLLAEAFWLLEGFFARAIGMHRVYMSAVMHLLRDQDNAGLRGILRDVLAFDPRLLGRFANYLTTPDERPAAEQFGKGDRYFGAAVAVATLPGLPLIGHGQIEGLTERYGMEYVRPAYTEGPDLELVARHERELVPLLRERRRFADPAGFRLLDLDRGDGGCDEDVLVWSLRGGGSPAVTVFHNRDGTARGRVRRSAPVRDPDTGELARESLLEALGLRGADGSAVVACHDRISGLRYAVTVAELEERGWPLELGPNEYRVLDGFRLAEGEAARTTAAALAGRGTRDLGF